MRAFSPDASSESPAEPAAVNEESPILALDIGTRSVVGIIGRMRDESFEISDYEQYFHKDKAMSDGQIEDIELVASAVSHVKKALETRSGLTFKKAAVAAAGRALKTVRASYTKELDEKELLTKPFINALEYAVVNEAQQNFLEEYPEIAPGEFFCVGYSIVSYSMDGYAYSNLEGHRGRSVTLDAIAAFLPIHVVSCLYAVTERNGLEIENLTLEPIAAINVIVPKDIRLLNIAIVDIGAGTSDIAISRNGSIGAYGMVTIAGDEITEAIMQTFLADFETAESIKLSWAAGEKKISFTNIFGLPKTISSASVKKACAPAVETLCKTVSDTITSVNGGAPTAVFLVGGGSGTPGLCPKIADMLGISRQRVSIGGQNSFKNVVLCSDSLQSPEFVTPIGIGVVCSLYRGCNFFSITVNDRNVMLLDRGSMQVMDALLPAGIKPSRLIGLSSPGLSYTLNREKVFERGKPARPGVLTVNGEDATIHTPINQGDTIRALPAENGTPVQIRLSDIISKAAPLNVSLDGQRLSISPSAAVNGSRAGDDYIIREGDNIILSLPTTLGELLERAGTSPPPGVAYTVNGKPANIDFPITSGSVILSKSPDSDRDVANKSGAVESNFRVCINGVWRDVFFNRDEPPRFVDMLVFSDIDPKNPKGDLELLLNGRPSGYLAPVSNGDIVEIRWQNSLVSPNISS